MPYTQNTTHPFERFGPPQPSYPTRRWIVAMMCSVFLGAFGVDRFYIGHTWLGLGKLFVTLMSLGFLSWVWWAIDVYLFAKRKVDTSEFRWDDEQPHYNKQGLASSALFDHERPYTSHTPYTAPAAPSHHSTDTTTSERATETTQDTTHYVAPSSVSDREPLQTSVLNADNGQQERNSDSTITEAAHEEVAPDDGAPENTPDAEVGTYQDALDAGDTTDRERP